MKIFIFISMITINHCLFAQIKTMPKTVEEISLPYDSTRNCLSKSELEQYRGHIFYLPKTTMELEKGFSGFKRDIKGNVFKPTNKTTFAKTKYETIAGRYFDVIGIERNTRAYKNDVYIHLRERETGDELYYDYGKDIFPFIVQGYYEKARNEMIGRTFYFDFGKVLKRCVDYYIEEGLTYSEILKFDDNTTRIVGDLLFNEDAIGRTVYESRQKENEIETKYGKLRLGINESECEIVCGSPIKKNVSEGEWGKHEQWVYDDKFIYLENGKVTSIQYEKQ